MNIKIIKYKEIDSTNTELIRLAKEGYDEGTVLISEKQTHGKGQGSNNWVSEKGGLYFSILLRPKNILPLLSLMTGIVITESIKEIYKIETKIKWPNDIIFNNKKIAGILIECSFLGNKPDYYIVGCGINVNQKNFPVLEKNTPSSLKIVTGKEYNTEIIFDKFINIFFRNYNKYLLGDKEFIIDKFKKYSFLKDKTVLIQLSGNKELKGIFKDIDKDGSLIILDEDKKYHNIFSGRVINYQ